MGIVKNIILNEIHFLDNKEQCQLTTYEVNRRLQLKDLFIREVREEEIKWRQRSRWCWLKEGGQEYPIFP